MAVKFPREQILLNKKKNNLYTVRDSNKYLDISKVYPRAFILTKLTFTGVAGLRPVSIVSQYVDKSLTRNGNGIQIFLGVRARTLISFKKALVTKYYPIYQHQQPNIKTFLFALHLSVYISPPSCSKLG